MSGEWGHAHKRVESTDSNIGEGKKDATLLRRGKKSRRWRTSNPEELSPAVRYFLALRGKAAEDGGEERRLRGRH